MIQIGDRIKIKTEDGSKYWGRVAAFELTTDIHDVTAGGLTPGGPPPDPQRKSMPGLTAAMLTVEIEGSR